MASSGDSAPADSGTGNRDTSEISSSSAWAHGPGVLPPGSAVAGASPRPLDETMHELRATVGGLAMASQLLADRGPSLSPDRRRRLQRMHDSETVRLERLLGGGRQTLVEVDLDDVLFPQVEGLRLRGHDVRWLHNHSHACGRPDDIAEIVHVLLENAVRHAPGTTITIEPVAFGRRWAGVRVFDRGPGVADEARPILFVRGGRGSGSPGLGLGLNVAQRLAEEMGGSLVLEPTSCARGASFRLTLPRNLVPATGS